MTASVKSFAWGFFEEIPDSRSAKCELCGAERIYKDQFGKKTSGGLTRHLAKDHGVDSKNYQEKKKVLQTNMESYTEKILARDQQLAKLVALDGFTLNQIATSDFLKRSFLEFGWVMPSNPITISKIICEQASKKTEADKFIIQESIQNGGRFSVILDEWTSLSNKRFMAVIAKSKMAKINLGLAQIVGSLNSQNLLSALCERLAKYGINISSIISICFDGAAEMKCMQASTECVGQICLAHGFHLAVKDSFGNIPNDIIDYNGSSESDEAIDQLFINRYSAALKKMNQIIDLINHSDLLSEKLCDYLKKDSKKDLKLHVPNAIRWNSLHEATERFLYLWPQISKVLADENEKREQKNRMEALTIQEQLTLTEISTSLEPMILLVKTFSGNDFRYAKADQVIEFVLSKLKNNDTHLAGRLFESLLTRVKERRNKILASTIAFLNEFDMTRSCYLDYSSKSEIIHFIRKQFVRLFGEQEAVTGSRETIQSDEEVEVSKSIDEEFKAFLDAKTPKIVVSSSIDFEIGEFEAKSKLGPKLFKLKNALEGIPLTSISAEHCFSLAGNFVRNSRNRISDELLDALITLCDI